MFKRLLSLSTTALLFALSSAISLAQPKAKPDSNLERFTIDESPGQLRIAHNAKPVATFVYQDEKIFRPFFANLFAPAGIQVTRTHPPVASKDATDHDTMHPGIWLAFGDVRNGSGAKGDFWRNKDRIEHVKFTKRPAVKGDQLQFATESCLRSGEETFGSLLSEFRLELRPAGWLLEWDANFQAGERGFSFGDQEEMGFGARVATPLTEKNGGLILNSHGGEKAAATWGKAALWCDYSGPKPKAAGITVMPDPANFRESWWHNRDYGVFVANPFGRAAMRQGAPSLVDVKPGESFRLSFAACLHDAADYDPKVAYRDYLALRDAERAKP